MEKIDLIYDLLVKMDERMARYEGLQASQHELQILLQRDVKYHIKRTDILQESVRPVVKYFYMVQGVALFLGFVATISTIIAVVK